MRFCAVLINNLVFTPLTFMLPFVLKKLTDLASLNGLGCPNSRIGVFTYINSTSVSGTLILWTSFQNGNAKKKHTIRI